MPTTRSCPDPGHGDVKKKHSTFLGSMLGKIHSSSSNKKTPRKTTVGDQSHGGGTVKKLFPFSGGKVRSTPYGESKKSSSTLVGLVASPARLFRSSEDVIPAHGGGLPVDGGSSIRVVVRVRPKNDKEHKVGVTVCAQGPGGDGHDTLVLQSSGGGERQMFSFDTILSQERNQQDVYEVSGKGVVLNCLKGCNGCLLAYGQTGSGKTFSMMGDCDGNQSNRGIIQRSFEDLFAEMKLKEEECFGRGGRMEYSVKCSFIEIYNEAVSDLTHMERGSLVIRDDPVRGVFVEGVEWHTVHSMEDIDRVLSLGMSNRRVEETMANERSSRSHSVFTAMIEQKITRSRDDSMTTILRSQLHLVDLAGSERQKVSGAAGERLKEASNINKSLSALGHVIMSLVDVQQGKQRHVPYRDSKLTFLLQDALGGSAKTVLLATISPASLNAFETLSTLRFADNVKRIKNKAVIHQDAVGDTESLQKEVNRLRQELDRALQQQVPAPAERDEHKALMAALAREERICSRVTSLQEEIHALQSLNDAKEADLQRTKMMLRLKESRITQSQRRTTHEDIVALQSEIALLKEKIESHPDVKRFALENIRLQRSIEQYAATMHVDGASMVPAEDLDQLRAQVVAECSRAEKAEEEIRMLKAEAVASKEILRTAEKKRETRIPRMPEEHARVEMLESELDDLRVVSNQQVAKISEYEALCRHAGDLDSVVEERTRECRVLKTERDDWYDAYAVLLQSLVHGWNTESELTEHVRRLKDSLQEETRNHAESYTRAKNKIAEAATSACLLQKELESASTTISTLEQSLDHASRERDMYSKQVEDQNDRLELLQRDYDKGCRTISELQESLETHKQDLDVRVTTISVLESQVDDLHREIEGKSNQYNVMEKEQKSLQAALASAQLDQRMAESQLREKSKQLAISEESESELRASIIRLQEELQMVRDDSEAQIYAIQQELEASKATMSDIEEELEGYKNKCSMLNGRAVNEYAFNKERAALQARIKELEEAMDAEKQSAMTHEANAGPLGKEAHVRNISQKLRDAEDTVSYLRQEVTSLKASIKSRDETLAKLRNQMATEVNDAAQQVQELLAAQGRVDALEKELSSLKKCT